MTPSVILTTRRSRFTVSSFYFWSYLNLIITSWDCSKTGGRMLRRVQRDSNCIWPNWRWKNAYHGYRFWAKHTKGGFKHSWSLLLINPIAARCRIYIFSLYLICFAFLAFRSKSLVNQQCDLAKIKQMLNLLQVSKKGWSHVLFGRFLMAFNLAKLLIFNIFIYQV